MGLSLCKAKREDVEPSDSESNSLFTVSRTEPGQGDKPKPVEPSAPTNESLFAPGEARKPAAARRNTAVDDDVPAREPRGFCFIFEDVHARFLFFSFLLPDRDDGLARSVVLGRLERR